MIVVIHHDRAIRRSRELIVFERPEGVGHPEGGSGGVDGVWPVSDEHLIGISLLLFIDAEGGVDSQIVS